jgi:drug/metabolite transporter superfamily protein YnfA
MKCFALNAHKVAEVIAGIAFWFTPLRTATQLFICIGSFLALMVCSMISSSLDDENTGYLPK